MWHKYFFKKLKKIKKIKIKIKKKKRGAET